MMPFSRKKKINKKQAEPQRQQQIIFSPKSNTGKQDESDALTTLMVPHHFPKD